MLLSAGGGAGAGGLDWGPSNHRAGGQDDAGEALGMGSGWRQGGTSRGYAPLMLVIFILRLAISAPCLS
jgi:hypothetical protein